jgi:hypothetical protein
MKAKNYPSIARFFNKKPKVVKSSVVALACLTGTIQTIPANSIEQPQPRLSQILENSLINSKFITELHNLTIHLPLTVPIAVGTDPIASFAVKPTIDPGDDNQWEIYDQVLNGLLGWGKSEEEISQIIRHGPLGMDGFCNWIEALLVEGNIAEELLEGKLSQLIKAMKKMFEIPYFLLVADIYFLTGVYLFL